VANIGPAKAIILIGSPQRNTSAPAGLLVNSGWQYEGTWGNELGTAIGPHSFITASHVGGNVGDTFTLAGIGYTATGETRIAGTDLAVWQVAETLPTYAPLYEGSDELNQAIVLYGRGVAAGDALTIAGTQVGWNWGGYDGQTSWGTNTIDGELSTGGSLGDLLTFSFNQGDANTGILAPFDSGGGVFLDDNGVWKLAGVNYGIEEFYNAPPANGGTPYSAAIYDGRGLYLDDGTYVDPTMNPQAVPQSAAASRISSSAAAIDALTGQGSDAPEPGTGWLLIFGLPMNGSVLKYLRRRLGLAI
jgi:hypothetical protein